MTTCFDCVYFREYVNRENNEIGFMCKKGKWIHQKYSNDIVEWSNLCKDYKDRNDYILVVDPHYKHASWVLFDRDIIIGYNDNSIDEMVGVIKEYRPGTVVLEEQFIGINRLSGLKVSRSAGIIAGIAKCELAKVYWVNPRSWKSYVGFLAGRKNRKATMFETEERKRLEESHKLDTVHLQDCFYIYEYYKKENKGGGK